MTRRVFRYVVPVDDRSHAIKVGTIRHVAANRYPTAPGEEPTHVVEFWAEDSGSQDAPERHFQVYGTGHELPGDARWKGTCDRTDDGLVWHLFERWPT